MPGFQKLFVLKSTVGFQSKTKFSIKISEFYNKIQTVSSNLRKQYSNTTSNIHIFIYMN